MTSHDNVTDIVEQAQKRWDAIVIDFGDYKTFDCDHLAKWAIRHGSHLLAENATLRKQLENAREALTRICDAKQMDYSFDDLRTIARAALGPLPAPPTIE